MGKSTEVEMKKIFSLCWFVYYIANMGRLSYSAVMAAVMNEQHFTQSECGAIGTGLYICYGISQLAAGALGDYISPRNMVFVGMSLSSAMNLCMGTSKTPGQMLLFWCVNGAAQAMLWPPIIRVFSEKLHGDFKKQACVYMSATFAAGTLSVYFLAGMLLNRIGYKGIFFLIAILTGTAGAIWYIYMGKINGQIDTLPPMPQEKATDSINEEKRRMDGTIACLLIIMAGALVMQGMLRDGVTSWVPVYLNELYHKGIQSSTLATMVIPVINLAGVYAAEQMRKRTRQSELTISAMLFLLAAGAAGLIMIQSNPHIWITLGSLAVLTSCMLGINTMIVNVIPVYFAWTGRISLISGILNSSVYIGSSLAIYGIGAVMEQLSWEKLPVLLAAAAIFGGLLCLPARSMWKKQISGKIK